MNVMEAINARKSIRSYTAEAKQAVIDAFTADGFLCWLADELALRKK